MKLYPTLFTIILTTLICCATASAQNLYGFNGPRGSVTYTTKKPVGRYFWKVKTYKKSKSIKYTRRNRGYRARKSQYDPLIEQFSEEHNLEPALVKAVVHAESSFNHKAKSHAGAAGLMQLMPFTAKRFGVSNRYSPTQSIKGGVRYLAWLKKFFKGNITKVLAGYNAGENAVLKYGGVPPYKETKHYVRKVMSLRDTYRCDFAGLKTC